MSSKFSAEITSQMITDSNTLVPNLFHFKQSFDSSNSNFTTSYKYSLPSVTSFSPPKREFKKGDRRASSSRQVDYPFKSVQTYSTF